MSMSGICKVCGCTEDNACVHPDFGPCWWINDKKEFCSHCVELPDDPRVERMNIQKRKNYLKIANQII